MEELCDELCEAIIECELDTVRKILSENPTLINKRINFSQTPLHVAVYNCEDEYNADMLLDIPGIDLTLQDSDGDTAFNLAVAQGKANIVRRMIQMNPEVLTIFDNYGDTPMHAAHDNTEMLRTLIEAGGRRASKLLGRRGDIVGEDSVDHRYFHKNVVGIRQQRGMTVLEMARACGNTSGVAYLQNFICY